MGNLNENLFFRLIKKLTRRCLVLQTRWVLNSDSASKRWTLSLLHLCCNILSHAYFCSCWKPCWLCLGHSRKTSPSKSEKTKREKWMIWSTIGFGWSTEESSRSKALRFHQKDLHPSSEDERNAHGCGTTCGWVMAESFCFKHKSAIVLHIAIFLPLDKYWASSKWCILPIYCTSKKVHKHWNAVESGWRIRPKQQQQQQQSLILTHRQRYSDSKQKYIFKQVHCSGNCENKWPRLRPSLLKFSILCRGCCSDGRKHDFPSLHWYQPPSPRPRTWDFSLTNAFYRSQKNYSLFYPKALLCSSN